MSKVFMNGSLHWLTWKRNVFVFDVKRERYCLFALPLPVSEVNDNKDILLRIDTFSVSHPYTR